MTDTHQQFTTLEATTDSTGALIADLTSSAQVPEPVPESDRWVSYVVPNDQTLHLVDVASLDENEPRRATGTVHLHHPDDLCNYVIALDTNFTRIYCDRDSDTITAVLNDHQPGVPGWGDLQAVCRLRRTPEAAEIVARSGHAFSQTDFAEWLEQFGHTIAEPNAATVMEIALTLESTKTVDFRSAVRLRDGQRQLTYSETIATKAGTAGELIVPDEIVFVVEPYQGFPEGAVPVTAKLRYRIREGNLLISFVLVRADEWRRNAFDAVVELIEQSLDVEAVQVLRGDAPEARRRTDIVCEHRPYTL